MKPHTQIRTIPLLNIELADISMDKMLALKELGTVFPMNLDTLVTLQSDLDYYRACSAADFLVVDSQILFFLLTISGIPVTEKISGSDLFPKYCRYHKESNDVRIFIVGGIGNVASIVQERVNRETGREIVVGACSPSMGFENNPQECSSIIDAINRSGATVVAVGVGAPKQEKWIHAHRTEMPEIRTFMAVGATLDFIAGTQRRAPQWMQNAGLEWFFRLIHDPGRLFYRYILRDVRFFYYFLLSITHRYRNPFK